ncbi:TPA: transposase [Mannheimia haemolytica]
MSWYRRLNIKGGIYFLTVVLQDRKSDYLLRYIAEFRQAYTETQKNAPFETIAICILPNHFHLLMKLPDGDEDFSKRIRLLKINFNKRIPLGACTLSYSYNQQKRRELGIWQRRFWEHLIRDEKDLANHIDYIYYNPVKHGYVKQVKDWKFSSFHRDVKKGIYHQNWGGNPTLIIKGEA